MKAWGSKRIGELSKRWPKDEAGQEIPPAFFQHIGGSELDVEMAINLLEAYDIPVLRKNTLDGDLGTVLLGFAGAGADLYVPESLLEDARNIVSADILEDEDCHGEP
ncbi:MAG: DUF2007 domain-containing protein [Oscillospiraceae bacterium]|nr:DUF2007 domain-containing protein [Oscillospiraceae bacterium]